MGSKLADAYFVQVDKELIMTDEDNEQEKMIVKVGMAAVRPA